MKWFKGKQSSNEDGDVAQSVYQNVSETCSYCGKDHSANGICSQADHDIRKEIATAQKHVGLPVTGKMKK